MRIASDGATYNTAFFLGRDDKQIGRYHKTCPTWFECGARNRGETLPVFPTPDLGAVGMLNRHHSARSRTDRGQSAHHW